MTTTLTRPTTRDGRRVNSHSGLCAECSEMLAQSAVFWTDDAEFDDPGEGWTAERRFVQLQRVATDARARCVESCGRADS